MSDNKQPQETRSATQRLADLEQSTSQIFGALGTLDLFNKDLSLMKSALKLLDNKLNAFIKATIDGERVTDDVIDRIMIENNVNDLANKVNNMVVQGIVSPEDTVSENAFIVGRESDVNGTVTNPRVQFALKALAQEVQEKFLGAKVGDVLTFQEGKLSFTLLESYKINEVPLPTPETPAAAPEAPQAPEATPASSEGQPSTN